MSGILGNDPVGTFELGKVNRKDILPYPTENYQSQLRTHLKSAVGTTDSRLVTLESNYPSAPFTIEVDGELMRVIGVSGNVLTVVRNSSPAAHSKGASVCNVVSHEGLQTSAQEMYMIGPEDQLPSPGVSGRIFQPTNTNYKFIDDGTNWRIIYRGQTMPAGNVNWEGYTAFNLSIVNPTLSKGGVFTFNIPNEPGDVYGYVGIPAPTAPYQVDTFIMIDPNINGILVTGLGILAANGKFTAGGVAYVNNTGMNNFVYWDQMNAVNSYNTNWKTLFLGYCAHIRMIDDGTNVTYYYSNDGVDYLAMPSFANNWHGSTPSQLIYASKGFNFTKGCFNRALFTKM